MDENYVKKLVIARLKTIPPDVSFSIGSYGDFSRDQVISEVMNNTDVGKEFIKIELKLLLDSPKLARRLSEEASSD